MPKRIQASVRLTHRGKADSLTIRVGATIADLQAADVDSLDRAGRAVAMPEQTVASVGISCVAAKVLSCCAHVTDRDV